jgi:hypothetical protein
MDPVVRGMRNVRSLSFFGRFREADAIRIAVTGCIRPELLSRLNPGDAGGQYDSSGGAGGRGNPAGSVCLGCEPLILHLFVWSLTFGNRYKHYVELVEPSGKRACIKCCDDPADCPVNKGALRRYHLRLSPSWRWGDNGNFHRYARLPGRNQGQLLWLRLNLAMISHYGQFTYTFLFIELWDF